METSTTSQVCKTVDPVAFGKLLWPDVTFYDRQREIIYSVQNNVETVVPAGNCLGKDFVSAFICLWFFLTRTPCRIITTSADYNQLKAVLWGEIRRFIQTSKYPLESTKGGPLIVNDLYIKKLIGGVKDPATGGNKHRKLCPLSYIMGRVAAKGEGMLGHHIAKTGDGIPRTFMVGDEASGIEDITFERANTWAERRLYIGNTFPCANYFFKAIEGGDILND